jgi:peptidylprolyl isomerase/FKBP-type peptidyl-prolyl cis-trans isomerase FkpA
MKMKYILVGGVWAVVLGGLIFIMTKNNAGTVITKTTNSTTNTNTKTMNVTELKIEDEVVGTGEEAKAGDTVTVQYIGTLTNGTTFDASRNRGNDGFKFALGKGQVIKGWDVGVAGMKVGGKRRLTIPSDMAYGNQAVGGVIPANSTLIFEVEFIKVSR